VLYWDGPDGYEADLLKAFLPLAERSDHFVDVGAALGYYALVAAAVNPSVRVVAFEPTPGTFGYLERNVLLNRATRITPERLALADAPGEMEFFITTNPKFPGMAQLAGTSGLDSAGAARDGTEPERVLVKVETLDRYVNGRLSGVRIDLLKLDTEATEDRVLAGSERVLAEHRPVVLCEVLPGRIEEALEAVFERQGYVFARALPEGLTLSERLVHGADVPNDHVMVPRERLEEVRSFVSFA
jgi:FkbM family methyltransferase